MAGVKKIDKAEGGIYPMVTNVTKMSAWQPIDINPFQVTNSFNAVTNGFQNSNYATLRDAYDDSPTHASIINSFVNYMYADGLANTDTISGLDLSLYLDEDTTEQICFDTKLFGGFALQVIWNDNEKDRKILKFEYVPIDRLAVEVDKYCINPKIIGYWYSFDWRKLGLYPAEECKKFNGTYQGGVEIYVCQRVTKNNFFPLPDYFSGINYMISEGYLGQNAKNHFKFENKIKTIVNINNPRKASLSDSVKEQEAEKFREAFTGGDPKFQVTVCYNQDALDATTIDQVEPEKLSEQNVFFAEECERKIIVAHSAPKILFSGSNNASGFSSNADEILVATKELYRRNVNPLRKIVLDGLTKLFRLVDVNVKLEFIDFEEFRRVEEPKEVTPEEEKV